MPVPITALYLAIFALFATGLYVMCGRIRGPERISLGDGGRTDLHLAMRRHANFVENVPYFMIMMAALEPGVSPRTLRLEWSESSTWSTLPISFGISGLLRETVSKRCGETGRAFIVFA